MFPIFIYFKNENNNLKFKSYIIYIMYKKKYIKYKSKYLDLKSFIETRNKKGGMDKPGDGDDDEYPVPPYYDNADYPVPPHYDNDDQVGNPILLEGGSIKKSNSVCKLCNNKCNSVICSKCSKTEKGNLFIEQLYGGDLSNTSISESE
uniref:Uncharacterized protein n=1 Tax=viral metagenome TaxID=1070528 RepID=A0A6C0H7V4_9ZZZZ